jgi:predicted unusual protein kinase regulating ubiquinone biosynthesis (AarF/ABC1/UbiB family)
LVTLSKGPFDPASMAEPLRRAFEDAGGTFVKFGQIVASSPGLFGDELSNEFRSCLDTGPLVPFDQVKRVVEDELGVELADVFALVRSPTSG